MEIKNRSTIANKWLKAESTELNPDTGEIETHSQEEWLYKKHPSFKKLKELYYAFPKRT
tara:strand:+ start:826 stop:1002 length:177 start_codon:yes stop_codon:yes gene_type:complete